MPDSNPLFANDPYFGQDPVVQAYKQDIDRTLIRENLKLTVEERFQKAMSVMRFAEELKRAGRAAGLIKAEQYLE